MTKTSKPRFTKPTDEELKDEILSYEKELGCSTHVEVQPSLLQERRDILRERVQEFRRTGPCDPRRALAVDSAMSMSGTDH